MSRTVVVLLLSLMLSATVGAQQFSSLEERMSAADFRAAGLDKLTAEELAQLNDWLRRHAVGGAASAAAPAPAEDRRGFTESYSNDDVIVSTIPGEFRGWSKTGDRFELANGQIWQSVDPAARLAVKVQDPVVRIKPGFMNAWFLSIDGYNSSVRVKRVR